MSFACIAKRPPGCSIRLPQIARIVKRHGKIVLVDSMSAFGGVPLDLAELGIDFLVSSANKCIQGVPGFGFVIARRERTREMQRPGAVALARSL